jgi:hypothetical protein
VHFFARDLIINLNAIELLPQLKKIAAVTQRSRVKENIQWVIAKLVNNNEFSTN